MTEFGLLLAALLALLVFAFNRPGQLNPFLAVLVFPVLILAALRLKTGAHLTVALTSLLALWFSAHGMGPLVQEGLSALDLAVQVFSFLAIASVSVLVLVAVELEREVARVSNEALKARLHQAQKMEAIGRLTGGIAHDFNNMLTVILGHAELAALDAPDGNPVQEHLNGIRVAGERSAELTQQLLGFARQQPASPRVIDINETSEGMLGMLRKLMPEDIVLRWHPGQETGRVWMDPVQLHQILMNLCTNARDAIGGRGSIVIETEDATFDEDYCETHPGFIAGDFVVLSVTDDGEGIEEEVLAHAFEPFFTTKVHGKGTGLGLATVYGIVKQNDGFVNIYSEPGIGTTVKIYLPRVRHGAMPSLPTVEPTSVPKGGATIILVDDAEHILNLAAKGLRQRGYEVFAFSSPEEALAHGRNTPADLLVTDVVMAGMNGRQLAARLKEVQPGLKVLFTSGYAANVIASQGILNEGVNFLGKPYTPESLAQGVQRLLDAPE